MSDAEAKENAAELTEPLGLRNSIHELAGTLSSDMRRKLNIALSFAGKPKVNLYSNCCFEILYWYLVLQYCSIVNGDWCHRDNP